MSGQRYSNEKLQVLIVEDHFATTKGIRAILEEQSQLEVVGERSSLKEAIAFIEKNEVDIIVTDLHLGNNQTGIELTVKAKQLISDIKVVFHTYEERSSFIKDALRAGADAYTFKNDDEYEFVLALTQICKGKRYYSPRVADLLQDTTTEEDEEIPVSAIKLTEQEKKIMILIAKGKNNNYIAQKLNINANTLSSHRKNLYQKLGVSSDVFVSIYAYKYGLVKMGETE
jgi:DNA-binding NarL/FixJ family response regulator